MKHIISFSSLVIFDYATALVDFNNLDCTIDKLASVIWTNDKEGFIKSFDADGIDPEEFSMSDGNPIDYDNLVKRLEVEAEAQAAAMALADADGRADE